MENNPLSSAPGPADAVCGQCVWHYRGGRGRPVQRCRRHGQQRVGAGAAACESYTAALDCLSCGACCREAYDAVEVGPRDPFVKAHPELVSQVDGRLNLARTAGICAALRPAEGAWPCRVYAARPKTCQDFEVASDNCLIARMRIGLQR